MTEILNLTHIITAGDRFVPWLSRCADGWRFRPLKYLCKINELALDDDAPPSLPIRYIDISAVDSNGIVGEAADLLFGDAPSRARRILRHGDTFLSTVRTYLTAIAFCDQSISGNICSTGFAVVTPGPLVHPKFLFYWSRSSLFVSEVVARSTGVSYPAINASEIGNLPFPLIDLDYQAIVASWLDDRLSRLDAMFDWLAKFATVQHSGLGLLIEYRQALITAAITGNLSILGAA